MEDIQEKAPEKAQQDLPGIQRGFPELEQIGFQYAQARDKRLAALAEEVKLKKQAIPFMQEHGLKVYKTEGLVMRLVQGKPKLRVTTDGEEEADSEEDLDTGEGDGEEINA